MTRLSSSKSYSSGNGDIIDNNDNDNNNINSATAFVKSKVTNINTAASTGSSSAITSHNNSLENTPLRIPKKVKILHKQNGLHKSKHHNNNNSKSAKQLHSLVHIGSSQHGQSHSNSNSNSRSHSHSNSNSESQSQTHSPSHHSRLETIHESRNTDYNNSNSSNSSNSSNDEISSGTSSSSSNNNSNGNSYSSSEDEIKEKLIDVLNNKNDLKDILPIDSNIEESNNSSWFVAFEDDLDASTTDNNEKKERRRGLFVYDKKNTFNIMPGDFVKLSRNEGTFDFYGQIIEIFENVATKINYIKCKLYIAIHDNLFDVNSLKFAVIGDDSDQVEIGDRKKELYEIDQMPAKVLPVSQIQLQIKQIWFPVKTLTLREINKQTRGRGNFWCRYSIDFKRKIIRKLDGQDENKPRQ